MNFDVKSYMFKKDFGVSAPSDTPYFVMPISSVATFNTKALRYALGEFIEQMKEQEL